MEIPAELFYRRWREQVWALVDGGRVLEIGVGTGKNFPFHPEQAEVIGVELSESMLARARRRAQRLAMQLELHHMDAQNMTFADDSFDSAVATFVFCSVPDAVLGLKEMTRVVKPGGRIVLLEHMRARNRLLGKLMDLFDPLVVRLTGPHINRRTLKNIRRAGLEVEQITELDPLGIYKLIEARTK